MAADHGTTERILDVLKPYASNWTGTLGRGDLVIPQREIQRLIREILEVLGQEAVPAEATEQQLFEVLMAARRSESVQEQAAALKKHFRILVR